VFDTWTLPSVTDTPHANNIISARIQPLLILQSYRTSQLFAQCKSVHPIPQSKRDTSRPTAKRLFWRRLTISWCFTVKLVFNYEFSLGTEMSLCIWRTFSTMCVWFKFLNVDWTGVAMIVKAELGRTKYNE